MKKNIILFLVTIPGFILSCKKDNTVPIDSSLDIINAAANIPSVVVNFSEAAIPFYQNQAFVYYSSSLEYGFPSGVTPIVIVSSSDTTKPIFQGNLNLAAGGIYSLYLIGQSQKPDTFLMEDNIVNYTPDLAGVRFINLSPDSGPISVNIQGNAATQTEFNSLAYKQISDFKTYDASVQYGNYTFEVRDQATGILLTTFAWNYTGSKNNTLVISGSVDPASTTPITVFQVNNF